MLVDLRVAQLLCSRLCHDLIGPVGAINTGFELLEDEAGLPEGATGLVVRSAREVSRRLAFYRIAFGLGGGDALKPDTARAVLTDFLVDSRVDLDWPADPEPETRFPGTAVKLLLNLALVARESLPRGGVLSIRLTAAAEGVGLALGASGTGAKLREEIEIVLGSSMAVEDLSARSAPAYLAVCLAADLGTDIAVGGVDGEEVKMTIMVPAAEA
jgi:histidine phosphotransferase ChpT